MKINSKTQRCKWGWMLVAAGLVQSAGMAAWAQGAAGGSACAGHLEVGTRVTGFRLEDSSRSSDDRFYGSIDKLDAVQDYWPIKVFVDYNVNPYWGIDLTWDQVQADTITKEDGHNDGTLNVGGPIASVFVRYPGLAWMVPYAGGGVAYYFSEFNEENSWRYPPSNPGIRQQTFHPDDAVGWVVYAGVSVQVVEHWYADLYVRHTGVSVKGEHDVDVYYEVQTGDFKFPLDNDAIGLGVRYAF